MYCIAGNFCRIQIFFGKCNWTKKINFGYAACDPLQFQNCKLQASIYMVSRLLFVLFWLNFRDCKKHLASLHGNQAAVHCFSVNN